MVTAYKICHEHKICQPFGLEFHIHVFLGTVGVLVIISKIGKCVESYSYYFVQSVELNVICYKDIATCMQRLCLLSPSKHANDLSELHSICWMRGGCLHHWCESNEKMFKATCVHLFS